MKNKSQNKSRLTARPSFIGWFAGLFAVCILLGANEAHAQYQITSLGAAVTENFNGMQVPAVAATTNINFNAALGSTTQAQRNSAWVLSSVNGRGNDNGGGSPGGGWTAYSNINTNTNKALGQLGNGSYSGGNATATFANVTGSTVTSFLLSYTGEQWRANSGPGTITVQYSVNGGAFTALSGSTFNLNIVNATNINNTTTAAGALNGYAAGNFTNFTNLNVSGLSLSNGQNVQFRFLYTVGSNSKAVAIDDISVTFNGGGGNVSRGAGTTFTASSFGGTAFTSLDTAVFDGTGVTVNLSGAVVAAGLNFTVNGYTLASPTGSDTISTPSITVGSGITSTISGIITGANPLTKAGDGRLILSGSNDFVGNVALSSGVLQIASDDALGNTANDLAITGTLNTTASMSLNSGRDVTGTGVIDVDAGTALTVNGSFNMSSLTLTDTGTLSLQGATRSVGALTFGAAGSIIGSGAVSLTTLTATAVTSGTATVVPALTFTSGDKTVDVGTGGALYLDGAVTLAASNRILKTGTGTLILDSIAAGGVRIGAAAASPTNGGTVVATGDSALGTIQTQLNYGTLEADNGSGLTFANGVSIGGRSGAVAVLAGDAITFGGTNSFFRGAGTSGALRLDVNNSTTFSGTFAATSGAGTATGITIGGSGTLTFSGNATGLTDTITTSDTLVLVVNNSLGSSVNVAAGTTLQGSGSILGTVTVDGALAPGSSPGLLTVGSLVLGDNAESFFELGGTTRATDVTFGDGTYDAINITSGLTLNGTITVTFFGTFDASDLALNDSFNLLDWGGILTNSGFTLDLPDISVTGFSWDTSNFAIDGSIAVVPEPSTYLLFGVGLGFSLWRLRRRRLV